MTQSPNVQDMLDKLHAGRRQIPPAIGKAAQVDETPVFGHMHSRGYAMPAEGALDEQTRTLIYPAAALAASSQFCIQAMTNKAAQQNIPHDKLLETVKIVRYAMTTKVIGDAEPVFDALR